MKKKLKEIYFFRDHGKRQYTISAIDTKGKYISNIMEDLNRIEVDQFITTIKEEKNSKFMPSKRGLLVCNKKPRRNLDTRSQNLVTVYLNNLSPIKEGEEDIANFLRATADLISGQKIKATLPAMPSSSIDSTDGIIPEPLIDEVVPFSVINFVQEKLGVTINLLNLSYTYKSHKFVLSKDLTEVNSPEPKRPKFSNTIVSILQYQANLLGLGSEQSLDLKEHFFRFNYNSEMYKITYIYTGDHSSILRSI